jgi:beta-1,4-mannosyl-glycoprotein beta-1,4-N-acetylglucosaminyltransferase
MKKIFDCVTFFDEDILLEVRLNILKDIVDFFIIVEAKQDHQGKSKNLNFKLDRYKEFKDKIIYRVIDRLDLNQDTKLPKNWAEGHLRDQFQRNYILKVLNSINIAKDDIVIISDLDEIPDPNVLKGLNFDKFKIGICEQKLFFYKFNLIQPNFKWYGSRICKFKNLKSPQYLRNLKVKKKIFNFINNIKIIKNCGWHFTYLKTPQLIIKKLESFAHSEKNIDAIKNIDEIKKKISLGLDLETDKKLFFKVENEKILPDYLNANRKKYQDWILE